MAAAATMVAYVTTDRSGDGRDEVAHIGSHDVRMIDVADVRLQAAASLTLPLPRVRSE